MLNMVLLDTARLPYKLVVELTSQLSKFGNFTSYPTAFDAEVIKYAALAEVILVNKVKLNAEHFKQLPHLKYIIVVATGYDNVDIIAAQKFGIKVSNIPNYSTHTVAQHTIALLLELTNQVGQVNYQVKNEGKWYGIKHKHLELVGLILGVIGFGNTAQAVIKIAASLGMRIIVNSRQNNYLTDLPVTFVDKQALFLQSDVISLHCPLTLDTYHLINQQTLSLMKPTAFILNTSRGALINEADLYKALLEHKIQGAGLDVLNQEPANPDNNQLLSLPNCIITPHNAWLSDATLTRWLNIVIDNVYNYTQNNFINLVTNKN